MATIFHMELNDSEFEDSAMSNNASHSNEQKHQIIDYEFDQDEDIVVDNEIEVCCF